MLKLMTMYILLVEDITIEDNVLIASKVYIADHSHGNYKDSFHDCYLHLIVVKI
jgi:acetyltransferase-like isoleucine patch superfamily enzyme